VTSRCHPAARPQLAPLCTLAIIWCPGVGVRVNLHSQVRLNVHRLAVMFIGASCRRARRRHSHGSFPRATWLAHSVVTRRERGPARRAALIAAKSDVSAADPAVELRHGWTQVPRGPRRADAVSGKLAVVVACLWAIGRAGQLE
jgi:hypothetical protein